MGGGKKDGIPCFLHECIVLCASFLISLTRIDYIGFSFSCEALISQYLFFAEIFRIHEGKESELSERKNVR